MNQYEIAVLFDPDLEIDLEKATSRVEKTFKDNGSKIINVDNWGKRKLAYPVKKHEAAIYVFYSLNLPAENVRKVETLLNMTDEVIRFLIVRPDLKAMAKAEVLKTEKATKSAKHEQTQEIEKETDKE